MTQSQEFNFQGTCKYKGEEYILQMSVNAMEIVHRVKIHSTTTDPSMKKYFTEFISFAENKNLQEIDEGNFFRAQDPSEGIDPLLYAWQRGYLDFLGEHQLIKLKMKKENILCNCSGLDEEELRRYKSAMTFTMEHLVKETKAGTGCGSCRADCKKILELYHQYPTLTAKSYLRLWESLGIGKEEFICRCKKVPPSEIAQLLESKAEQRVRNIQSDLQTKWGIGLSCMECFDRVKEKLSSL